MAQLTAFKMPFDELRGKLATKQQDIIYSGQEPGTNASTLTEGKHAATNFSKYIVSYRRRGINRFMVKSNTTINQTIQAVRAKAAMSFAIIYADYVLAQAVEGSDLLANLQALKHAYDTRFPNTQTLREWIIGQFVPQVLTQSLLGYSLPDYRQAGVYRRATIVTQGFPEDTADIESTIKGTTATGTVGAYLATKYDERAMAGAWNTIRTYMGQTSSVQTRFVHVTVEGVKSLFVIPLNNQGRVVTRLAAGSVSLVFDGMTNEAQAVLYRANTLKPISGGRLYNLYTDASMTTALTVTDTVTELWAKEVTE